MVTLSGWRVWRAFDRDPVIDNTGLWRALAEACRKPDGKIDGAEFEKWCQILVGYRRGVA